MAALSVTAGSTEIAEANFAGNATSAGFLRADNPVNNGTLTMGWTAVADDVAALWLPIEETTPISGNVENNGSAVSGATVMICIMDSVGALFRPYRAATTDGSGNWSSSVPLGAKWIAVPIWVNGGNMYHDEPHMSLL